MLSCGTWLWVWAMSSCPPQVPTLPSRTGRQHWSSWSQMCRRTYPLNYVPELWWRSWRGEKTWITSLQEHLTSSWVQTLFIWKKHLQNCFRHWSTCARSGRWSFFPVVSATSGISSSWRCWESVSLYPRSIMIPVRMFISTKHRGAVAGMTFDSLLC